MKNTWGIGFFIGAICFASFIGVLAYKSVQQKMDLVSEDYYDREIRYDKHMKMVNNTKEEFPDISYDQNNGLIRISYARISNADAINGTINLYKPDDASADRTVNINPVNHEQTISADLPSGAWDISVSWNLNDNGYFHKERIYIPQK